MSLFFGSAAAASPGYRIRRWARLGGRLAVGRLFARWPHGASSCLRARRPPGSSSPAPLNPPPPRGLEEPSDLSARPRALGKALGQGWTAVDHPCGGRGPLYCRWLLGGKEIVAPEAGSDPAWKAILLQGVTKQPPEASRPPPASTIRGAPQASTAAPDDPKPGALPVGCVSPASKAIG
eukprot:CAMPEP_0172630644 /NCGR_PEP_ID=MMETSP1068-20121228/174739_1 /TAXON_ID=35684 /ORGANISM="Pseudopedinella elastica, Strain CCMP716" /LENGTH=178 /DNA_ID=CAMNT_0013441547 /DNA_START=152 /DNA_END=689 /DNA_ORIENTATION=-